MIKEAIATLANGEDIGYETAETVMNEIMSGEATTSQKSSISDGAFHERGNH